MKARRVVREAVRKLRIQDGDIVILDNTNAPFTQGDLKEIARVLGNSGRPNCLVIMARPEDIRKLDEAEMNRLGWVRKEKAGE